MKRRSFHEGDKTLHVEQMAAVKTLNVQIRILVSSNYLLWICWQAQDFAQLAMLYRKFFESSEKM